jgi:2Fe-2S ferredoxin
MIEGVSSLIRKRKKLTAQASLSFRILPENIDVPASQNQSILEALVEAEVEIDHSCGGMGTCGTCRIFVEFGLEKFEDRSEAEQEIAGERQFLKNERLSCQNRVKSGLILRKPKA